MAKVDNEMAEFQRRSAVIKEINQAFSGKTIRNVEYSLLAWRFHFTDGTSQEIAASLTTITAPGIILQKQGDWLGWLL